MQEIIFPCISAEAEEICALVQHENMMKYQLSLTVLCIFYLNLYFKYLCSRSELQVYLYHENSKKKIHFEGGYLFKWYKNMYAI